MVCVGWLCVVGEGNAIGVVVVVEKGVDVAWREVVGQKFWGCFVWAWRG
jgi:hypothetical protein